MADAIVMAARRPPTDPTAWSDISIAFWNSGGIRNSIKQGKRELFLLYIYKVKGPVVPVINYGEGGY